LILFTISRLSWRSSYMTYSTTASSSSLSSTTLRPSVRRQSPEILRKTAKHILPRPFFGGSSSFLGAGFGASAPPLGPKNDLMSGMSSIPVQLIEEEINRLPKAEESGRSYLRRLLGLKQAAKVFATRVLWQLKHFPTCTASDALTVLASTRWNVTKVGQAEASGSKIGGTLAPKFRGYEG
jgi:hypothetical protein